MARRLALTVALVAGACTSSAEAPPTTSTEAPPPTPEAPPTTEAPPVPTSTVAVVPTTSSARPAAPPPVREVPAEGAVTDEAFWRRLADCECSSGDCGGAHVGWFQFSSDTAAKVGIDGTEGYEEQRAAAIEWARRIHPREATRAGWPHCWNEAA